MKCKVIQSTRIFSIYIWNIPVLYKVHMITSFSNLNHMSLKWTSYFDWFIWYSHSVRFIWTSYSLRFTWSSYSFRFIWTSYSFRFIWTSYFFMVHMNFIPQRIQSTPINEPISRIVKCAMNGYRWHAHIRSFTIETVCRSYVQKGAKWKMPITFSTAPVFIHRVNNIF